jgi:hypothetical protein
MHHLQDGLTLLSFAAFAATSGCSVVSPYMHAVDRATVALRPDEAAVVFVRPPSACDTSGWFTVVDERGAYVGDSMPESNFTVAVPAGEHTFIAWEPYGELHLQRYPWLNQVGAVHGRFDPGATYFVDVGTSGGAFEMRHTCSTYHRVELHLVPDVGNALNETKAFLPDRGAGGAELSTQREEVERHIALGMQKLAAHRPSPPDEPRERRSGDDEHGN